MTDFTVTVNPSDVGHVCEGIDDLCSKLADAGRWDVAYAVRAAMDATTGEKMNLPGTSEDNIYHDVYQAAAKHS